MPTPDDQGIGTTPFFFVSKPTRSSLTLTANNYYIAVRLHYAKIIYYGGWWSHGSTPVKATAITTSASFSGGSAPSVNGKSINTASRKSGGQHSIGSGLQKLIVMPTPATMETLTLAAAATVSRRNIVNEFFELGQKEAFATTLGLGTGAIAAVKSLAGVIPGVLSLFQGDAPQQEDALAAAIEIPLIGGPLHDGYYITLGSQGENVEIPALKEDKQLTVLENEVQLNGKPLVQASCIVYELMTFPTKDITGLDDPWIVQYRETSRKLNDLIRGITPPGERDQVLSEGLKGLYTLDVLQTQDKTFTQKDKEHWREALASTYQKARAAAGSPPSEAESGISRKREEVTRTSRDDDYQSQLGITLEKLAEFNRPAVISFQSAPAAPGVDPPPPLPISTAI